MIVRRLKRPRGVNALAKLIGDIATGQVVDAVDDGKDPAMSKWGAVGGAKGGRARAAKLSAQERSEIATKAAKARWGKKS